jgi:hypothetical protein
VNIVCESESENSWASQRLTRRSASTLLKLAYRCCRHSLQRWRWGRANQGLRGSEAYAGGFVSW